MTFLAASAEPGEPAPLHTPQRSGALVSLLQAHWFIRLRWAFVAAALASLGLERFITPAAVRPPLLVIPILLLAIVNLVWMGVEDYLLRRFRRASAGDPRVVQGTLLFANAQVSVDLLLLTLILRYTGGVENPMALFYLFHMSIGALLLRPVHAVAQGLWAMLLYGGLAIGELGGWIAPHYDFLPQFASPGLYARGDFVAAMLIVMASGVFAMLYFTLHITGRLERRERELHEAHEALRQSRDALFDLQQRRARLLQTAAHQLKGPLAAIETFTGLLIERLVPNEAVVPTYEKIRQRCREGVEQVTELLTLARVQRADPTRHGRSFTDAARIAREVCARYAPLAESKGLRLHLHAPEHEDTTVLVDPADLTDCLSNLVDNAIKYTTQGAVTVSVSLGGAPNRLAAPPDSAIPPDVPPLRDADGSALEPAFVAVTVTDSGLGLDPQSLAQAAAPEKGGSVFDAFRRGNNALAAAVPGTGLGLAIVREVVEQSGGRIFVRSRQGEGSSFTVTFPTHEPAPERAAIRDTRSSVVVLPPHDHLISHRPGGSPPTPSEVPEATHA